MSKNENFTINFESPKTPEVLALIQALDEELLQRYPAENVHSLDLDKIDGENNLFLVVRLAGQAVGCGAVCKLEAGIGEIKRVFITPRLRGRGLSKAIMNKLEAEAVRLGYLTLRLETGDRQPEALGLYESLGYTRIPNFGEYVDDPLSVCMEKRLNSSPPKCS
jgi:putative acetyltransferase